MITGAEPAVVLLHGFPDDMHLYDWVLPDLTGRRRVITFDFLGWGDSDKPAGHAYTAHNTVTVAGGKWSRLLNDRGSVR